MYKTLGEAVETALALKPLVANANHCEVVIAPVFTAVSYTHLTLPTILRV